MFKNIFKGGGISLLEFIDDILEKMKNLISKFASKLHTKIGLNIVLTIKSLTIDPLKILVDRESYEKDEIKNAKKNFIYFYSLSILGFIKFNFITGMVITCSLIIFIAFLSDHPELVNKLYEMVFKENGDEEEDDHEKETNIKNDIKETMNKIKENITKEDKNNKEIKEEKKEVNNNKENKKKINNKENNKKNEEDEYEKGEQFHVEMKDTKIRSKEDKRIEQEIIQSIGEESYRKLLKTYGFIYLKAARFYESQIYHGELKPGKKLSDYEEDLFINEILVGGTLNYVDFSKKDEILEIDIIYDLLLYTADEIYKIYIGYNAYYATHDKDGEIIL